MNYDPIDTARQWNKAGQPSAYAMALIAGYEEHIVSDEKIAAWEAAGMHVEAQKAKKGNKMLRAEIRVLRGEPV